ncbi:MAG: hypothetical protein ACFFBD_16910, partial [Candidatus Hodarchaeota archaeon]
HPEKKQKILKLVKEYETTADVTTTLRKAPLICGELIRTIRRKYEIKQTALGRSSTISQLENGVRRTSKARIKEIVSNIEREINLEFIKGEKNAQKAISANTRNNIKELSLLRMLASGEYLLDEIIEIEKIKYDGCMYVISIINFHGLLVDNGLVLAS